MRNDFQITIRNKSGESVYLFYSDMDSDSVINNNWLCDYLKDYYVYNNDTFINIREILKPNAFIRFRDIPINTNPKYKLFLYILKCDTTINCENSKMDSDISSKVLLKQYRITSKDFKTNTLEIVYE